MQLTTVESSMIHAAGYDDEKRELEVVFNSGGVYRYKNVEKETFEELMAADSKGRYMRAHIIDMYPYYKLS